MVLPRLCTYARLSGAGFHRNARRQESINPSPSPTPKVTLVALESRRNPRSLVVPFFEVLDINIVGWYIHDRRPPCSEVPTSGKVIINYWLKIKLQFYFSQKLELKSEASIW